MRKLVLFLFVMFFCNSLLAQVYLGVRDTRYFQAGYQFHNGISMSLEQSVYSENYRYQKIRVYAGYEKTWKDFTINAQVYGSSLWAGGYQDAGALLSGEYSVVKRWSLNAAFNPHYDSSIKYQNCYSVGTSVMVHDDIALMVRYTTIPEYRESEKRVRVGISFKVRNLTVQPEISIPASSQANSVRCLCTMRYEFSFK